MASGMPVHEDVSIKFNEMKIRRTAKWIIFKIEDKKTIVVDCSGNGDYKEFVSKLPPLDCRYAVYDNGNKLQAIMWCPDNADVKPRMLYASSKDALIAKLPGAGKAVVEAHDLSELDSRLKITS